MTVERYDVRARTIPEEENGKSSPRDVVHNLSKV